MVGVIIVLVVSWCVLSVVIALIVGRAVKIRDAQEQQSKDRSGLAEVSLLHERSR